VREVDGDNAKQSKLSQAKMAIETIEMPEGPGKGPKYTAFVGSNFDRANLSKFILIHPNARPARQRSADHSP
jgi:hypothetical protein